MAKKKKYTKLYEMQQEAESACCNKCGSHSNITVDHIIPKHFLEMLGFMDEVYNDARNFKHLCGACNSFKASKIDVSDEYAVYLLQWYALKLGPSRIWEMNKTSYGIEKEIDKLNELIELPI
jgi:5-methylcytosine-specific restriction endonuclease McrA